MRSSEIKGLGVFNIANGSEIGKVSELLIDAQKKAIEYMVIDIPNWFLGVQVIPYNQAEGVGKDAVIIKSEAVLKNLNEEPAGIVLVEKGVKLIGNKVLTEKGKFIGTISEYDVDENTGQVIGCELIGDEGVKGIIPSRMTLSFGKDALIVDKEAEKNLLKSIDDYKAEPIATAASTPITIPPIEAGQNEPAPVDLKSDPVLPESEIEKPSAIQLYEQKQREYLLGREVKNDIYDNGNLLIAKGDVITEEVLDKAALAGKLKEILHQV